MILDQSLLQPSKHLGRATCESVEPTQSNKHETHPSLIGGLAAPQPPNDVPIRRHQSGLRRIEVVFKTAFVEQASAFDQLHPA